MIFYAISAEKHEDSDHLLQKWINNLFDLALYEFPTFYESSQPEQIRRFPHILTRPVLRFSDLTLSIDQ